MTLTRKFLGTMVGVLAAFIVGLIRTALVPGTLGFATAQTADVQRESVISERLALPVAAATTIYKGSLVCVNSSGYAVPASDTSGLSNVIGVADEQIVNTTAAGYGSNGDLSVVVVLGRRWIMTASSIAQSNVGDTMYVVDDTTVDESDPGNGIRAGILTRYISATQGEVLVGSLLTPLGTVGTSDLASGAVTAVKLSATLKTGFIPIDITSAREIASNAIQNLAAHGGIMAVDSQPDLARINGATDKALRITWAATEVDEIQFPPLAIPPDYDNSGALTIHLLVYKDANMDTGAVIDVQAFSGVGDTEMGGNTAAITETAAAEKSVSLTGANVGAHPGVLNISLVPGTHANDALYLLAAWAEYTRA